jgi:hypothetical protein
VSDERETGWQEELRHNRTLVGIVGTVWLIYVIACIIVVVVD